MKGRIELQVLCHTETSRTLEDLDLKFSDNDLTYRTYIVQISSINSIAENPKYSKGSYIMIGGNNLETKETKEEIIKMIKDSL